MLGWLKNLLVSIFVVGIIIFSSYMTILHTNNVRAIGEVDGAIRSAMLGETRGMGMSAGIDKDEFYGAVVDGIVNTQKKHNKTVRVKYIFLDKDAKRTEISEQIKSVQYELTVVNKDGIEQSKAVKSLAISDLGEGERVVPEDVKSAHVAFGKSEDRVRSKTVTISDLGQIVSVTTDNGNVSYTVNGKDVTVNVAGGTPIRSLVSGEYTPADTKYVNEQTSPNYNKDGYVGVLTEYDKGSTVIPDENKHVDNQMSSNYDDGVYKTKPGEPLQRYVAKGEYIAPQYKYVSGQSSNWYNDGVYSGTLPERTQHSYWVNSGHYEDRGYWKDTGYWQDTGYYETRSRQVAYQVQVVTWCYEDNTANGGKVHSHAPPCSNSSNASYGWETRYRTEYYDVWVTTGQRWVSTGSVWVSNMVYVDTSHYEYYYTYAGTVTKPEVDTRIWRYQGTVYKIGSSTSNKAYQGYVTRPATDTRVYKNDYQYNVKVNYK